MIRQKLKNYLTTLTKTEDYLKEEMQGLPRDTLIVSKVKGRFIQCFLSVGDKKKSKRYLHKKDWNLAYEAAQREYDEKLLAFVTEQRDAVREFLSIYNPAGMNTVLDNIPEAKRTFIKPLILPDEDFITHWYQEHPGNRNATPFSESFPTERGELVRSKSEKIIADKLFYMGIPYVYESELQLNHNHVIYPDFTILNVRTRETKYLEHFGIMDDPGYGKKAIKRIELYRNNGYWEGEKLFYTMENSIIGWDMVLFERLIKRYFK